MSNNMILERLEGVKSRFIEVSDLLTQPDILSDMKKYVRLNKEYKDLQPVVESYEKYKLTLTNISSTRELLASEKDEEIPCENTCLIASCSSPYLHNGILIILGICRNDQHFNLLLHFRN